MVIDTLSASPSLVESERVSHSCRRAIPWDRAQITFHHLKMVGGRKSWKVNEQAIFATTKLPGTFGVMFYVVPPSAGTAN
jgi:hypothetical protein